MSGPLCGKTGGTTVTAQVDPNSAVPAAERQNKTPIYVTGVTDTRGFLSWLRGTCQSGLSTHIKRETLLLVPRTADGSRATVSALRSLDGSKDVSFHTFSRPEDRCVRLLVKNLGRHMLEDVVREELENLGIRIQGVLQLPSGRRDQAAEACPLTPHFIVSVARGPDVAKVRSLIELRGLRVSVKMYIAPKGPLQCKLCQRFGHTQRYCGYAPRCFACWGLTYQVSAPPHSSSVSAAAAEETTRPSTKAMRSGKRQKWRLLRRRRSNVIRCVVHLVLPPSRQIRRSRPRSRRD